MKVSAVVDGEAIFSEEIVWEPVEQTDPDYHYAQIRLGAEARARRSCRGSMPSAAVRPA